MFITLDTSNEPRTFWLFWRDCNLHWALKDRGYSYGFNVSFI